MSLLDGITSYPAFCIAVFLFLALPGPGTLALLSSTSQGGLRAGVAATWGVIAGDQILLWLAAAGLATLLTRYPLAFSLMQALGAAYLIWLGLGLARSQPAGPAASAPATPRHARRAFLITVLNPKAIFFYLAFFPQFIRPHDGQPLITLTVMAVTIALLTAAYGVALCAMASKASQLMSTQGSAGTWFRRLLGLCLMGFGLRLLYLSAVSA